jgi:gamma-polyglutamate biosynthesis protein CapA
MNDPDIVASLLKRIMLGLMLAGTAFFLVNLVRLGQNTSGEALVLTATVAPPAATTASSISSTSSSTVKILFVGDMNFDRYIRQVTQKNGGDFLFSCVDPLLKSVDFAVGNLEGPVTANKSVSVGTVSGSADNYRFTFPTSTPALLLAHNFKIVNIGNNHIGNFGLAGIASTKRLLTEAGVAYFGGEAGSTTVYRLSENGQELSFVNYNQFGGDSVKKTAQTIAAESAAGRNVIAYAHWGEEYVAPTKSERAAAAAFAAAGASLIIGSHPHVVQESETIGSTMVYYSLGNFIFDQYWNTSVTHGLAVEATLVNGKWSTEEKPLVLNTNGQTCETKN